MSIYIGDKEIKNLYAGGSISVSDMQGPCPDGFHVPLKDEWVALYNVGVSLGAWTSSGGNDMKTYLKLPMAGYRSSYNAAMDNVGTAARYWSSSYYDTDNVYVLVCYSSGEIYPQTTFYRAGGFSIRGFKNTPVEPTSSRTKLYGTSIESGGIFWSSTDGLISLSSDGQTWITIADKNVGATTVYNSGDTLSEANCGKQYQRGNNYGFPVTGTVTTSLDMVNAADYGPGNYYSSSTFIKRTSSPYGQWDSSSNNNLRGGVTQGTTETGAAKAVYLGENLIRPVTPPYLCFTANTAGSTIKLQKSGSPTSITLETSKDGSSWNTYTFGTAKTLSNVGDKIYWRNTSETDTGFSFQGGYYYFSMTGSIAASGDVTYLINKNSTTTLSGNYCFRLLFDGCSSLTTPPRLPATTLTQYCYSEMFRNCGITKAPSLPATTLQHMCYDEMFNGCSSLEELPSLPATTLATYCYYGMFQNCSKIKISSTQTGDYQTAYRIPTAGYGAAGNQSLSYIFAGTGGTFKGTPTINTTYYTSNTVV